MALASLKPDEKLTSPVLRATLLSSSFDGWRRNQYKATYYIPAVTRFAPPLSIRRITPKFASAHKEKGYDYVQHLVCHEMDKYEHSRLDAFRNATARPAKFQLVQSKAQLLDASDGEYDVNIRFDADSDITTVTIYSIIFGVSPEEGEQLVRRAEPVNWTQSPGNFFQSVTPGHLVGDEFHRDDSVVHQPSYQIQESVQWNWAPQLESTGNMVNVLAIEKKNDLDNPKVLLDHVAKVFKAAGHGQAAPDYDKADFKRFQRIDYTYRLVRCVASKFLSSWVPGGLDVDDGRYVAIWCPPKGKKQPSAFLTTVQKKIHYSQAAEREAFPQFAQLLNMLAPAVITMLLKELAFNSTLTFVNHLRAE